MADKDDKEPLHIANEEESEYQPTEEEYVAGPEEKPRSGIFKALLSNRRLWLVVGIIVAVAIVYQFVKTPKGKEELQSIAGNNGQPTQTVPAMATTTTTTTTANTLPTQPAAFPTVAGETPQQADALITQNQQNQAQIQQLQTTLQQLQSSVQQVNTQVARCNAAPNFTQVPVPVLQPVIVTREKRSRKTAPRVIYHVRAIVPGRAWLLANNGHATTVKVGDYLPGYGRVQRINPASGKVWTSWNSVITYGKNDS